MAGGSGGCAWPVIGAVKGCGCVLFGGAKDDDAYTGITLCLIGVGA